MEFIIIGGLLIIFVVISSKFSKKKQDQYQQTMTEKMVPGAWVQTIGGFCGKIVEIDGDVVVLETPSGDESLWLRKAIARIEEPPFAVEDDDSDELEENEEKVEEISDENSPFESVEEKTIEESEDDSAKENIEEK